MRTDRKYIISRKKKATRLVSSGNYSRAKSILSSLIENAADDAALLAWSGQLSLEMGDLDTAAAYLQRAVTLSPNDAEACFSLGKICMARQQWEAAIHCFTQVWKVHPDHKGAASQLGVAFGEAGHHIDALRWCRIATTIAPENAGTYRNLGLANERLGLWPEAVSAFDKLVSIEPAGEDALQHLANSLLQAGEWDRAEAVYGRLLELKPKHVQGLTGLAKVFDRQGRYAEAYALLAPCLQSSHGNADMATVFASVSSKLGNTQEGIAILETERIKTSNRYDTQSLNYQLGKLYESKNEYETAFDHYCLANAAQTPSAAEIDAFRATITRQLEETLEVFSDTFLDKSPRAGHGSGRPVFIIGMPRSGTSLLEQILASHGEITGGGELTTASDIALRLPEWMGTEAYYPRCLTQLTQATIDRAARYYLDYIADRFPAVAHVTDKMPQNFMLLGFIHLMFPAARIIHCTRNPLDTCLSIFCNHFPDWHVYSTDLQLLGWYYGVYRQIMQHWEQTLDTEIYTLSYERLVSEPETTIRELLNFCGLEWDAGCLDFYRNSRYVNTLSYEQVRAPINTRSVDKWKKFGCRLDKLLTALEIQAD